MPIVWEKPDGSVRVMNLSGKYLAALQQPEETTAQAVARIARYEQTKNPDLADAVPTLVTTANMPTDRSQRHKWRLDGPRCVVDMTIPDPPHPKQSLLDRIASAATLDEVKQRMIDMVRMQG